MSRDQPNAVVYLGPPQARATAQSILQTPWTVIAPEQTTESVSACIGRAVAVLDASMRVAFDRVMLARTSGLRVIATATTGTDHIDREAVAARGIALFSLAGERELLGNLTAAAEHSWLLLMACARQVTSAAQHVLGGEWQRERFPGIMLRGKSLGVVGCGRIGTWMFRYAEAFGMRVLGYDPFLQTWPAGVEASTLPRLLEESDFVSIHVPLNENTASLFGERELALMRKGAVLINTSRGRVVDESALLAALRDGHLAAAGLDVLDGEPDIDDHPLVEYARAHSNLLITPHIGGNCPEAVNIVVAHAARRIVSVLEQTAH